MVYGNKSRPFIARNFHTKTDFGEWRAPVSRQLRLFIVKASLASYKVQCFVIAPKLCFIEEGLLGKTVEKEMNQKICEHWNTRSNEFIRIHILLLQLLFEF